MLNFINNVFSGNNPTAILQSAPKPTAAAVLQQAVKPTVNYTTTTTAIPQAAPAKKANPTVDGTPVQPQLRKAKLIMVTANNNNKYYDMSENSDGTFSVAYGRIGSRVSTCQYPMTQWDKKKREKIRKGYTDTTHLFTKEQPIADFLELKNEEVRQLMADLMRFAKKSISTNYNVSSEQVTMQQVQEAQAILDNLTKKVKRRMRVAAFNEQLTKLYTIIPRRMARVQDHLITAPKNQEDLTAIETKLAEEQATLDVMCGQVELNKKQADQPADRQTLLDAFGLEMEPINDPLLIDSIKKMMGNKASHFRKAYKVINLRTQQSYDQYMQTVDNSKTELFWHGSRNENWLSILKAGLQLRPANAVINGKMFGYGLYFADKFAKSLNYTSLRGSYWTSGSQNKAYLSLYEVHVGNQLNIKKHASWCYELSQENLQKRGAKYNSVFAKGGADLVNNEYIIYNQNQCTVRYIVEVQ